MTQREPNNMKQWVARGKGEGRRQVRRCRKERNTAGAKCANSQGKKNAGNQHACRHRLRGTARTTANVSSANELDSQCLCPQLDFTIRLRISVDITFPRYLSLRHGERHSPPPAASTFSRCTFPPLALATPRIGRGPPLAACRCGPAARFSSSVPSFLFALLF